MGLWGHSLHFMRQLHKKKLIENTTSDPLRKVFNQISQIGAEKIVAIYGLFGANLSG